MADDQSTACRAGEPGRFAIVVARHEERLEWLYYMTTHLNATAFVYTDGKHPRAWAHVREQQPARVHVIRMARGTAGECDKYLRHIVSCYEHLQRYEWVVFTQAYPFDHSPDFVPLLQHSQHWTEHVQALSYHGHPAPWGPFEALANGSWSERFVAGRYRVWCSRMGDDLQAEQWRDPWLETTARLQGRGVFPLRVRDWWRRELGAEPPLPAPQRWCKVFGAIFAARPAAISGSSTT